MSGLSGSSADLFDLLAPHYDEHFAVALRRAYDDLAWERVSRVLPAEPALVIDAGCGIGRWARRFLAAGHRVIGIEPAPRMAEEARRQGLAGFTVVESRMEEVDLSGAGAALLIAMGSLQYTDDPSDMIARMVNWVAPGGWVCVLVDSLVALVLELVRAQREHEALDRLRRRRGVWRQQGLAAEHHLLDRRTLQSAFAAAGLRRIGTVGLLVTATALGRDGLNARLAEDWDGTLELERRLGGEEVLADAGKQLLAMGQRPA